MKVLISIEDEYLFDYCLPGELLSTVVNHHGVVEYQHQNGFRHRMQLLIVIGDAVDHPSFRRHGH